MHPFVVLGAFVALLLVITAPATAGNGTKETDKFTDMALFQGLPEAALTRIGIANGNPMSARAGALHIAGHELHHLDSL